mmetsp:Transcript_25551/g.71738  ORF Transcript_25551/g.71738 Transcript_25551/m.71738 type:complete len:165 (+) Transcript_25551:260-754(+)
MGDPSYFPTKLVRKTGQVVRSVCIMDHPIKKVTGVDSAQIIIPQKQVGRSHDMYVSMLGASHCVSAKGKYIAIASTTVETEAPAKELDPCIALIEPMICRFDSVSDTFAPAGDGRDDHCFISTSYDATSHFESVAADVMDLYQRITGEKLDLTAAAGGSGEEGK